MDPSPAIRAQGGGWGLPPGPPGGSQYGGPPGGPAPPGWIPPIRPPKPITGGKETLEIHAMGIDPRTGLPRGESPPASTASIVALVAGFLVCLGPLAGTVAIVAGIIGRRAASADPTRVGGAGLAMTGIVLGSLNILLSVGLALLLLIGALTG